MTKKQEELYIAIKEFINKNGYSPTVRELNKLTNKKSTQTTYSKLVQLREKGYITFIKNKARTIKILK